MKKLRGICAGAGYFSQFHYEAWKRIPNVDIVAICDQDEEKAKQIVAQYGFPNFYYDIETMLQKEQADFIDIITPPNTHLALCGLAAKRGLDIICQKPLAPTITEAKQIDALQTTYGVRIMVHENFRFQPWHRELKKLLLNRAIGETIFTINVRMRMGDGWQEDAYMNRQPYFREMERLLIYETGIHFVDVFRYLVGEITSVNAKLKTLNTNIKGEDFAWVNFEFENGTLGFLDANRYNESTAENPRLTFGYWQIDGNKGSLRLYEDGKITIQKLGGTEMEHPYTFEDKNFAGDCVYHTQLHFVEALLANEEFETGASDYLKNLKIQDAIYDNN
nr:Gfo/Idh/MocA family oxidoreductase [Allomuricauda sp.]